jgi:hypothetical protein
MSHLFVYLILILDVIKGFFSAIAVAGFSLILFDSYKEGSGSMNELIKNVKKFAWVPILSFLIFTFLPSTKQAVIIYIIPKITENRSIQDLPKKLIKVIDKYLDEEIKELVKRS